jgi:RNA recognition motif-containing protein
MNVYVGNLSGQISEEDLRAAFEPHGKVGTINLITDSFSDRPLGFGFVEMPDEKHALKAVKALNRSKIKDRTVMVCDTAPRTERRGHK